MRLRHERASTVLTSNKGFEEWGAGLGDEVMAAALIDRLLHHCTHRSSSRAREAPVDFLPGSAPASASAGRLTPAPSPLLRAALLSNGLNVPEQRPRIRSRSPVGTHTI